MTDDQQAEQKAETTAPLTSPVEATNQPVEEVSTPVVETTDNGVGGSEVDETPVETDSDRNWRALREENERLKALVPQQPQTRMADLTRSVLTDRDNMRLEMEEFKAKQMFAELDPDSPSYDPIFEKAVTGDYVSGLNAYLYGQGAMPSPTAIAKQVKTQWDTRFGAVSNKAKEEGAKAAKQATAKKEATVEHEGRSDRGQQETNAVETARLREASRKGGLNSNMAIAERLKRSGF